MQTLLFAPVTIGQSLTLANRIVMAPIYLSMDGRAERFREFYVRRAAGGAGLLVVPQSTHGGVADWEIPGFEQGFKPLIDQCHERGARVSVQVFPGAEQPAKIAIETLHALPERYALAAEKARDVGFDAITVHGAHHSLLAGLLSPKRNGRTDCYGGSAQNRRRVQCALVRVMRERVGPSFPIFYRLSAIDYVPGGITLQETAAFAKALERSGVDCMDVSAGTRESPPGTTQPGADKPQGCYADIAGHIKRAIEAPVIAVGRISHPDIAESILSAGKADLVALGRQLIADPGWPRAVRSGDVNSITYCRYHGSCRPLDCRLHAA
jgi:2,4-dienoyl-CoA reductase-like NADH-dependent reductase (Old Yellow Enzyme family)